MPFYHITHITRYTYSSPVIDCANQIMLYPIANAQLEIRKHELNITNNPAIETFLDNFGNLVGMFSIIQPHTTLSIESVIEIVTKEIELPQDATTAEEQWTYLTQLQNDLNFLDFLTNKKYTATNEVMQVIAEIRPANATPFILSQLLSTYIYQNFTYQKGITDAETKMDEAWKLKAGVCQDFAHILLVMIRMAGIPARYVSGYICPLQYETRGEGATHAWVEAFIPGYGWLGLDPTNNCIVNDRHVKLATGRSFNDCTPVKGTYKGSGTHKLEVYVKIGNAAPGKIEFEEPVINFAYSTTVEHKSENSYRQFAEIQQQQQQQQ